MVSGGKRLRTEQTPPTNLLLILITYWKLRSRLQRFLRDAGRGCEAGATGKLQMLITRSYRGKQEWLFFFLFWSRCCCRWIGSRRASVGPLSMPQCNKSQLPSVIIWHVVSQILFASTPMMHPWNTALSSSEIKKNRCWEYSSFVQPAPVGVS